MTTPTLAEIYAKCEEIREQQARLAERFAAWNALAASARPDHYVVNGDVQWCRWREAQHAPDPSSAS